MVVPEAAQRVGHDRADPGTRPPSSPVACVPAVAGEPSGPGRHVGDERSEHDRHERQRAVLEHGPEPRRGDSGSLPGLNLPRDGEQPERRDREQPAPLRRARQPQQHRRRQPPRSPRQQRSPGAAVRVEQRSLRPPGVLAAGRVAVDEQAGERRDDEHRQDAVEQRDPAHGNGHAVDGEQQSGERAEQRGPEQPATGPYHEYRRDDAGQRAGQAPSVRIHAEQLNAAGDQPLAGRGMDDERGVTGEDVEVSREHHLVGPVDEAARFTEPEQRVRVLRVVRLVEHQPVWSPEIDEPQRRRDGAHEQRRGPAHEAVRRHRPDEPLSHCGPARDLPVRLRWRRFVLDHCFRSAGHARHPRRTPSAGHPRLQVANPQRPTLWIGIRQGPGTMGP